MPFINNALIKDITHSMQHCLSKQSFKIIFMLRLICPLKVFIKVYQLYGTCASIKQGCIFLIKSCPAFIQGYILYILIISAPPHLQHIIFFFPDNRRRDGRGEAKFFDF